MLDGNSLSSIFLECVDSGSFAAAGRRLNLTRSSVGKAIAKLEAHLGVRLFHRTTRHQGLTEDGIIFLDHARRAQSELEAARQIFASGKRIPSGILRAALPSALGRHLIGPLLLKLPTQYPDLKVALSLSDRPVDLIDEGFDIAVRIGASLDSNGVLRRKIGVQTMRLYAATAYLQRFGTPRDRTDLEQHSVIAYSRGRPSRWSGPNAGGDGGRKVTGVLEVDDLDLLADAVVRGHGIASLPHWLADPYVATGALQPLSVVEPRSFDILVLWPQSDIVPLRVRAAIDHLVAGLPRALSHIATYENEMPARL